MTPLRCYGGRLQTCCFFKNWQSMAWFGWETMIFRYATICPCLNWPENHGKSIISRSQHCRWWFRHVTWRVYSQGRTVTCWHLVEVMESLEGRSMICSASKETVSVRFSSASQHFTTTRSMKRLRVNRGNQPIDSGLHRGETTPSHVWVTWAMMGQLGWRGMFTGSTVSCQNVWKTADWSNRSP